MFFPSDYFSYDDYPSEPDTPDCGDPREDMESFTNHIDGGSDVMDERNLVDDFHSMFNDLCDDVMETNLDEQMDITPNNFQRICEN